MLREVFRGGVDWGYCEGVSVGGGGYIVFRGYVKGGAVIEEMF